MELPPGRSYLKLIQKVFHLLLLIIFISMSSFLAIENVNTEEFRHEYTQIFSQEKNRNNFQWTQTFISSNTKTYFVKPSFCCVCFSFSAQVFQIINRLRE